MTISLDFDGVLNPYSRGYGDGTILLCSGALAELIYSRGDIRDNEFFRLTQTVQRRRGDISKARPTQPVTTIS